MPTKPLETVLYRELSQVSINDIIEIASPLLQEVVNYSTNAFARCLSASVGEGHEDTSILYRHIIEMTDGIEILVSKSCPNPANHLLRSLWEALLSIEYILKEDYVRRSLAWYVAVLRDKLKIYNTAPASEKEAYKKAIENIQKLLASPQLVPIDSEFQKHSKRWEWYQIFGSTSPSNIRELAKHLGREEQYVKLYKSWSTASHAHDILRLNTTISTGGKKIRPLREPNHQEMIGVTTFATGFTITATRKVLEKFRSGENIEQWYKEEISAYLRILQEMT